MKKLTTTVSMVIILIVNVLIADTILVPSEYPTIQQGINASVDGDTVLVANGTYNENDIVFYGNEIVLISENGSDSTIIDGQSNGRIFDIYQGESFNTEINGFTIQNGVGDGGSAIRVYNTSYITIKNCVIQNNSSGGWQRAALSLGQPYNNGPHSPAAVHVYDCIFQNNTGYYGSAVFDESNDDTQSIYESCIFKDNSGYSSPAIFGTRNSLIKGCLFYGNSTTGDSEQKIIANEGGNPEIINCTFANNNGYAIGRNSTEITTIKNCISYGNYGFLVSYDAQYFEVTYSNIEGGYTGTGNIDADPLFVDASNYDFHLQEDSPCIDTGDPDLQYNDPDGTRNDMGAFYFPQEFTISLSVDSVSAFQNDTVLVGVNVDFPADSAFSSAELSFGGFQGSLDFIEVETENSLFGDAGWDIYVNETDSLLITASGGSNDISGEGTLLWLKFVIPDTTSPGFIPITVESALFDEADLTLEIVNGGVEVVESIFYGDVSLNGEVHAYDASLILKYLVGTEELDNQQLLNANVSLDSTVSGLDASLIFQYVVSLIDTLPYDTTMGSLLASGNIGMQDGTFEQGSIVEVPIYLTNGENILSFESEFSFDPNALAFTDIVWSDELGGFTIESNIVDGQLFCAGAGSLPDGQNNVFATLQFTLNESFGDYETTVTMESLRFNENEIVENAASSILTSVLSIDDSSIPLSFKLNQNYPNPFNPITTIAYQIPKSEKVNISIFNINGVLIETLVNDAKIPGLYTVVWDAKNLSSGLYFYKLTTGNKTVTKKMLLLK